VVERDGAVVDHERYCPKDNSLLIDLNLIQHEVEVRISIDDLGTFSVFPVSTSVMRREKRSRTAELHKRMSEAGEQAAPQAYQTRRSRPVRNQKRQEDPA
jgi:hypothetical protein